MSTTNHKETDTMTTTTRTDINSFRATTEQGWDMAVDTAEIGHDDGTARKATAEADRESALEAWDRAETAIETGNIAAALEALEEARSLAASWGDDAPEREAIELVRRTDLLVALRSHDHGDGCLGIIIDTALASNPAVTVEELETICQEAEEDAAAAECPDCTCPDQAQHDNHRGNCPALLWHDRH